MERFVVTRTRKGLWSVSHDGETFAIYPTEEVLYRPRSHERRSGDAPGSTWWLSSLTR